MIWKKVKTYYHTLRYMKPRQVIYRVYYMIRAKIRRLTGHRYPLSKPAKSKLLDFSPSISSANSFKKTAQAYEFDFLNQKHIFKESIDWNYAELGKLWTYNLNYFDFLHQDGLVLQDAMAVIDDFIYKMENSKDAMEPFPIALRGINWIKFISRHKIKEHRIDDALYAQYDILYDNLEYHLLGNHLLENGFSLLFGAFYFQDRKFFMKAREILLQELQEQVLPDGAHFELTPMYHQIMLYRVLDCCNLMQNNAIFIDRNLESKLRGKASVMLGWLENITYQNGTIPHLNDSTNGVSPSSRVLFTYAQRLNIQSLVRPMKESGYRKYTTDNYEMVVDVGNIGPDYIPGHAHSDTFSFELCIEGKPWIVDTGISTYEANQRRILERSTQAHNTVMVAGRDQSEVWSSFRVAKRAKVISLKETKESVRATHNGYKDIGVMHTRQFSVKNKRVEIKDILESNFQSSVEGVAFLHFAPGISPKVDSQKRIVTKKAIFSFDGLKRLEIVDITIAKGYNQLEPAKGVKLYFENKMDTLIEISV